MFSGQQKLFSLMNCVVRWRHVYKLMDKFTFAWPLQTREDWCLLQPLVSHGLLLGQTAAPNVISAGTSETHRISSRLRLQCLKKKKNHDCQACGKLLNQTAWIMLVTGTREFANQTFRMLWKEKRWLVNFEPRAVERLHKDIESDFYLLEV